MLECAPDVCHVVKMLLNDVQTVTELAGTCGKRCTTLQTCPKLIPGKGFEPLPTVVERMLLHAALSLLKSPGVDQTDPTWCPLDTGAPPMQKAAKQCRSAHSRRYHHRTKKMPRHQRLFRAATAPLPLPARISAPALSPEARRRAPSAFLLRLRPPCLRAGPSRSGGCTAPRPPQRAAAMPYCTSCECDVTAEVNESDGFTCAPCPRAPQPCPASNPRSVRAP